MKIPKSEPEQPLLLEKAIAGISSQFIQVTDLDASINQSLSTLGEAAGACRVYLVLCDTGRTVAGITHEWCRTGTVPRKGTIYPLSEGKHPWWMSVIENGEILHVSEQAGKHGDLLKKLGAGAALMLPISMGAAVTGYIGFERKKRHSKFSTEEQDLLITAARIIGAGFERKQMDYCLKEYEDLYRITLDSMEDMVFVADTDQRIILANAAFKEWIRGHSTVADPVGAYIHEVVPFPPDATKQQYDRLQKTGKRESGEKDCRVGDSNILLYETKIPLFERGRVSRTITIIRDVTCQREIESIKNRAYSQIERNMEQFAILADHVRNPLQVIQGLADLIEDERMETISEQVRRINRIITQLDERWIESRKISSFWRRYS